jgi:hypothetical protein
VHEHVGQQARTEAENDTVLKILQRLQNEHRVERASQQTAYNPSGPPTTIDHHHHPTIHPPTPSTTIHHHHHPPPSTTPPHHH